MGKRLRSMGVATCCVLLTASVLTACTVSVPAGLLGAILSAMAFGALIVGIGAGSAGCEDDPAGNNLRAPPTDTGSSTSDGSALQDIGPCLSPPIDVGPCLSQIFDEGTCLQPPPADVGVCLGPLPPDDVGPCLSIEPPDTGPCLSIEPPDAEESGDEAMTPCLSMIPIDAGPCLSVEPPDIGVCLQPPMDVGPCLEPPMDVGPCLDMDPDAGDSDADTEDSDVEEEDTFGPCLSPPYDPPEDASRAPAPEKPAPTHTADAGWAQSYDRLVERGALPPDVAERLKRRPPRRI
jgi:hypothetical protein